MIEHTKVDPAANKILYDVLRKCNGTFKQTCDGGALHITFSRGLKKHGITLDDFDPQVNYAQVFHACEDALWDSYRDDKDMEFYDSADRYCNAAWHMSLSLDEAGIKLS